MSFDPTTFLNQTFEGSNDTKLVPVPAGEYLAIADKVDVKTWQSRDGSSSGLKLEIVWDIQDDNVKEMLGREKITSRQQQMLDLTDTGALDMGKGKNVGLGRIREALNLNDPTQGFAFGMIQGQMAKVVVSHRPDNNDPEVMYDEIKRVAKAS